jgi:hypothetical protein
MDYQKDFVEPILKSDRDFLLIDDLGNPHRFLQAHVGNAKFIYGITYHGGNPISFGSDAKIVAIANKDEVYCISEFFLGKGYAREIRQTAKDFYEYKTGLEEQVNILAEALLNKPCKMELSDAEVLKVFCGVKTLNETVAEIIGSGELTLTYDGTKKHTSDYERD